MIERDFDTSIRAEGINEIYETPCHYIENFYTLASSFQHILKSEVKIYESDNYFDICDQLYRERQKEFHEKIEFLNAWIACQKDKNAKLNGSKF